MKTSTLIFFIILWFTFIAIGYFKTDFWETIFIVIISYVVTDFFMDYFIKKGRGQVKFPFIKKKVKTSQNIALSVLMIGILVSSFFAEGVSSFFLIPLPAIIGSWLVIIFGSLVAVVLLAYHFQKRYA